MCYDCHGTSEVTLAELKDIQKTKNYNFPMWNCTSVNHLFISMTNHDGTECRVLATAILKEFIAWYQNNKPDNYFPEYGVEQMYSLQCLRNIVRHVEDNPDATEEELGKIIGKEQDYCRNTVKQKTFSEVLEEETYKRRTRFYTGMAIMGAIVGGVVGYLL